MDPYANVTRDVRLSPPGGATAAFFDLDGTVLDTHSVKDLFIERMSRREVGARELADLVALALRYAVGGEDFASALADSVANMRGLRVAEFEALCERVATRRLAPVLFPEARALVRAHQDRGHQVVMITSAVRAQAAPVTRQLGIGHLLCTELEVRDGEYSGALEGRPCYGGEKVIAARAFAREHGVEMAKSFFYSNGGEDIPLLAAVGQPVAVNPDRRLRAHARREGWTVRRFPRRNRARALDVARTLGTFGSVLPMIGAALPFRLLGAPDREVINFSVSLWAELASVIAGLELMVEHEYRLWTHRPAVFLFNHQSAIDVLITARLLREDMVGVAKREIRRQPLMGPALMSVGTVFIDREAVGDPRQALQPAVEALEGGRSVVVAPEGTRSRDGRLGPFKKGAFHLAMQAGVPIVPIVIHNAMDALAGSGRVVRPAQVKVTVLEPISTEGWSLRSVVRAARDTRRAYLEVLGPGADGAPAAP